MDLRMFIDLFQEIEVENLFKALDLCMEYVRLDLHVFNVGVYVTCSYSNDLGIKLQAEGCNVNMIIEVPYLFEALTEEQILDLILKDYKGKKIYLLAPFGSFA